MIRLGLRPAGLRPSMEEKMAEGTTVELRFLDDTLSLRLPGGWRVLGEYLPASRPGLPESGAALRQALEAPIGSPPLTSLEGRRIILAVDDISRPTPVHTFFPALLEWLESRGVPRADLTVLFALGVHRAMTAEEAAARLGLDSLAGLTWYNHDSRADAEHLDLGTTSRGTPVRLNRRLADGDFVICVGSVEPHPLLGFGGGLKMLIPGLAHEETIAANHMQGVTADRYNFVGAEESPMRLDLEEGAAMLGRPVFLVNALLNERQQVHGFVCGDPVAAHREGLRLVRATARQVVPEQADVVILASSPFNADLRQAMKSVAHVEPAVKDGGLIVAFLECRHGIGDVAIADKSLPNWLLRAILRLLGRRRVLWFVDKVKRGAGTEERFVSHFSLQVVRKNRILVHSPNLPPDTGRRLGIFRQFASPEALLEEAKRLAPSAARVAVFPMCGATYPEVEAT